MLATKISSAIVLLGGLALPVIAKPIYMSTDSATSARLVPEAFDLNSTQWEAAQGALVPRDAEAAGRGSARVHNHCKFPVYLYTCYQPEAGHPNGGCTSETTVAAGQSWSAPYTSVTQNGQSIKVGKTSGEVSKPIVQLEYTVYAGSGKISYDVSEVNGNPFGSYGFDLTTTSSSCFSGSCPAPSTSCPAIFTDPTNGIPHDCPIAQSIGLTVCSD